MRPLLRSILAVSAVGALHSVRTGRPARFAGIRVPGRAGQHALTIGSPLSAPPIMLVVLVGAARRGRNDVVRLLASMLIVGILGEVDTWTTLRRPAADPIATTCVVLDLVLPAALIVATPSTRR